MQSWQADRVRIAELFLVEAVAVAAVALGVWSGWGVRTAASVAVGGWIQVLGNVVFGRIFLGGRPGANAVGRWISGEVVKWVVMAVMVVGALETGPVQIQGLALGFVLFTVIHGGALFGLARSIGREPVAEKCA